MSIRLHRDGCGGYTAAEGRFTIRPVTMGEGVNNVGGWSSGHREWQVTDTRRESFTAGGRARQTVVIGRLYEVRDQIGYVLHREIQELLQDLAQTEAAR